MIAITFFFVGNFPATLAVLNKSSMDQVTPFVYTGTVTVPSDLYPTQFGRPIEIIELGYFLQVKTAHFVLLNVREECACVFMVGFYSPRQSFDF